MLQEKFRESIKYQSKFFIVKNMTDPILYISMLLGLIGIYILISSFGDDDDDNGGDGERYIYNLEFLKVIN